MATYSLQSLAVVRPMATTVNYQGGRQHLDSMAKYSLQPLPDVRPLATSFLSRRRWSNGYCCHQNRMLTITSSSTSEDPSTLPSRRTSPWLMLPSLQGEDILICHALFNIMRERVKKPVGILRVKVLRAQKLLKRDFLGSSDPYVQLSLSGDRIPPKKTAVKMNNLNPEWNEEFKLTVKDPYSQFLELHLYDWEQVGAHDKLGMQVVPLKQLTPYEKKDFTLDLLNSKNDNESHNKKRRGQIMLEITFVPFLEDSKKFVAVPDYARNESIKEVPADFLSGAGLLLVTVIGAEDVEGKNHSNPYALVLFKGEKKKTKSISKNRNPTWNEEFQFVLEEAPSKDQIHIEVMSKRRGSVFRSKESLGHVDINLADVVHNGRINEKYHLINSQDGIIHVEIQWKVV